MFDAVCFPSMDQLNILLIDDIALSSSNSESSLRDNITTMLNAPKNERNLLSAQLPTTNQTFSPNHSTHRQILFGHRNKPTIIS